MAQGPARIASGSSAWVDITGKPSTFPPSAHTQAWSTITSTPTTLSGYGITDAQGLDAVPNTRTVNGHALSADVTVTKSDVGLGSVENTALSTWAGSANVTTLGTVSTGTWNATAIADGKIASVLTGKTYNGVNPASAAIGFTIAGGTTSKTLMVSDNATINQSVATNSVPVFASASVVKDVSGAYNYFSIVNNSATGYAQLNLSAGGVVSGINWVPGVFLKLVSPNTTPITFEVNGSDRMSLSATGAVRFNDYGAGTLVTDSSGNVTASSDARLKNVTGSFTRGLSNVLKLTPRTYRWNVKSGMNTDDENVGFIAQEVLEAIPEAVGQYRTSEVEVDGKKTKKREKAELITLSDRPLIAALVNAVKELKAENDDLRARVSALENGKAAK